MDISFSDEDVAFRKEVANFFLEAFDEELQARILMPDTYKDGMVDWQKRLHKKGWVAQGWPVEYGGTGWSSTQRYIYETERGLAGAPDVISFGLTMVAPVIFTFGNAEQKGRFLPRILASEDWWCQGYSEPGSGSDLASLKTRAEINGEEYIVNGAKIWTTYAQLADWIFCLVRTSNDGKKQDGITFLLIDMKSPGIKVNPIVTIDGKHSLNEVEFNNVRVPIENRIGEQDKGWTYAKALLEYERSDIAAIPDSKRHLRQLREMAAKEVNSGKSLLENVLFQKRLSDIDIELMALEFTELRVLFSVNGGGTPGAESSLLKIKGTEIQQTIQELRMDLAAHFMGVVTNELSAKELGHSFGSSARVAFMYGRATTIYGGSNEIQKNIIAKVVLGL